MKEAFLKRDWLVVDQADIADTLTNPDKYYYLIPFMKKEQSLSQAAAALGMKANALFYQVKRLERLGLIYVTRVEKRKGRASKIYKAVAKRFIIPFNATSADTMTSIMQRMRAPADQKMTEQYLKTMDKHTEQFGMCLWLSDDELLEMFYAPLAFEGWLNHEKQLEPAFPALFSRYASLPLDFETAKEVQLELAQLLEKVKARATPTGKPYLMSFSIVPLND